MLNHLRHYSDFVFGISKADYRKLGGKSVKLGEKVTMTVDLTNRKAGLDYVVGTANFNVMVYLWSPHLGTFPGGFSKAYLKTIH